MRRSALGSIPLLALTAALLAPGAAATAARPTPFDVTFDFAAGEACSFPLEVHGVGKSGHSPVPHNPVFPGGISTNPTAKATITNLATGESVTVNIAGVAKAVSSAGGTTTYIESGHNLLFGEPQVGAGALATTGPIEVTVDENDHFPVAPDLSGARVRDLCAELA